MESTHLRITIIGINYKPEPTGIAPYTARLAEHLVAEGHSVRVITGIPHYPQWRPMAGYKRWTQSEVLDGVEVRRLLHYIPARPNLLNRLWMELSFGVRAVATDWGKPDVLLAVSPPLFASALVVLRARLWRCGPPVGLWVQDIYTRGFEEIHARRSLAGLAMRQAEGLVARSVDGVAVIHNRFQDYIVQTFGVPRSRVSVIRNWTHVSALVDTNKDETRRRWGWSDDDFVVLHAGNMGAKQGLENVVHSARLAEQRSSKVKFVFLGDGNRRSNIEHLARDLQRVQFIDPVSDEEFMEILAAADALLVNEKQGLREMAVPSKLTSYFSTGKPVIGATESDSTTAEEIYASRAGVRVDPGSPSALLDAADLLRQHEELSGALGESGARYANDVLSEDAAILQYNRWVRGLGAGRAQAETGTINTRNIEKPSRGTQVD